MPDLIPTRRALRRFVVTHRRALAAICVGLAVFSAMSALQPSIAGVAIVTAARDVPSGHVLAEGDLRTVEIISDVVPDGAERDIADITGRSVAAPLRKGEVVTDARLLGSSLLRGYPAGSVLVPVRIEDPATLTGMGVGDRVNVIAVDPGEGLAAEIVARDLPIVAIPEVSPDDRGDGVVVHLVAPEESAVILATAGVTSSMALVGAGAANLD
ncbi:SAF domain-containing protein [soil metagenome]